MITTRDKQLMMRCLELARYGKGQVSPNPLVGCVITKAGKIISAGFHKKFGALHAEADAIESALKNGVNLKGATMYVNLEPCIHFGKTSPCTDRIIEQKIARVVIGCKDPYKLVNGKGITKLRRNGIKVDTGILEYECTQLNKFFIKLVTKGIPYITIKAAQTMDGKIADEHYKSKWISSLESRTVVHKLRAEYDAVLVGANTVKHDNPELTVRHVKGRNPFRIVIDKDLSLGTNYKLFSDKNTSNTVVITSVSASKAKKDKLRKKGIGFIEVKTRNGKLDLCLAMRKLAVLGISSILVEGGAKTFAGFINEKLVDEFIIFTSPKIMGYGISTFEGSRPVDFSNAKEVYYQFVGNDVLTNIKF